MATERAHRRVGRPALFAQRAFVVPYVAETQSVIGDQLGRLALAVLVFDRTSSTLASALVYAITFLPAIAGGLVLGRLGDRYPPRRVMVLADLCRAALFCVMAVPGSSLIVVSAVLVVAVFLGPAFTAAEVGFLAAALDRETFRAATATRSATAQLAQVAGFAIGGAVIVAVGTRGALLVDAVTFAMSAVVIGVGLRPRRMPRVSTAVFEADRVETASMPVFAGLWRDDRTRVFMALTLLTGLFVVPEALAVPFGRDIGVGTTRTGVLIAMIPLGSAVGAALVLRVRPGLRRPMAGWMAVCCGLPLLVSAANPAWQLACACWFVSGVFAAYQVEAISALVHEIPERNRSKLIGVAGAWLLGAQGAGFAAGGLIASVSGAGRAVAIAGGVGSLIALALALGPLRAAVRERSS